VQPRYLRDTRPRRQRLFYNPPLLLNCAPTTAALRTSSNQFRIPYDALLHTRIVYLFTHHVQTVETKRLPDIREAAKRCGYAIGFHGTARRDFDLIAIPWTEIYATPNALAAAIHKAACGLMRENGEYIWERKPHGRIATAFPICWTGDEMLIVPSLGHIDLSVMGA
jgi:hypothetical protein